MTYSRAVVERAGELRRSGLSCREIARELDGPSKSAVARWTRSVAAGGTVGRAVAKMELPKVVGDGPVYPDIDPDDKDALIERLVLENAVLRAVNDVLKAASLDGMSNREKTLVIDRLRPAGKWSLRELTAFLRISRSSYDYQRRAIARPDRLAPLRALVRRVFLEDGDGARGYRFVVRRLRERGATSARPCRTSCGSPTSPSSGCPPAGRSTCRPSGTASTPRSWRGGPARARTPRSPTRRSRTPARCCARRGPRHPLRPRRALPLARLDLDLRRARPHQEHVGQGLQPGQRGDGGLLRPAQEGVLARQGLGGLGPRPLHRGARWLDRPLQYGEAQRCARRPHAGRVPRRAGKGRVTVQEIVRSSPSPGLKREIIHSHSHQGSQPLTRPPRAGPTS